MKEVAFMDPAIFFEVIIPLLEVEGTALICISTLVDSYNFFTDLCTARKPDRDTLFKVVVIEQICSLQEVTICAIKSEMHTHGKEQISGT